MPGDRDPERGRRSLGRKGEISAGLQALRIGGDGHDREVGAHQARLERAVQALGGRCAPRPGSVQLGIQGALEGCAAALQHQRSVDLAIKVGIEQVEVHPGDARLHVGSLCAQVAIEVEPAPVGSDQPQMPDAPFRAKPETGGLGGVQVALADPAGAVERQEVSIPLFRQSALPCQSPAADAGSPFSRQGVGQPAERAFRHEPRLADCQARSGPSRLVRRQVEPSVSRAAIARHPQIPRQAAGRQEGAGADLQIQVGGRSGLVPEGDRAARSQAAGIHVNVTEVDAALWQRERRAGASWTIGAGAGHRERADRAVRLTDKAQNRADVLQRQSGDIDLVQVGQQIEPRRAHRAGDPAGAPDLSGQLDGAGVKRAAGGPGGLERQGLLRRHDAGKRGLEGGAVQVCAGQLEPTGSPPAARLQARRTSQQPVKLAKSQRETSPSGVQREIPGFAWVRLTGRPADIHLARRPRPRGGEVRNFCSALERQRTEQPPAAGRLNA